MPAGTEQSPSSPSHVNGAADSKSKMPLVYQRISGPYQKNLKRETVVDIYSKWDNYDDVRTCANSFEMADVFRPSLSSPSLPL